MKELNESDLKWCLRRLPKIVIDLMKDRPNSCMLAGGYIRSCIVNEQVNDIDLFATSAVEAELFANILASGDKIIKTDNAFSVIKKGLPTIQIIHRWTYNKPEDIIPAFDFTIARATIWYNREKWCSLCDDSYYEDLAAKRLVYCSPIRIEEAGGSMLRVLKFYQRGYRIPLESLAAVIARLVKGVNIARMGDDSEESWAHILQGLLYEVDPVVDPNHIGHF